MHRFWINPRSSGSAQFQPQMMLTLESMLLVPKKAPVTISPVSIVSKG